MNATFTPISGFSVQFEYDRAAVSQAIAAQVAVWVNSLTSSFLSLCEATVSQGRQTRTQVHHRVIQAQREVAEATFNTTTQAKELTVALVIATGHRIQYQTLGWVLPPANRMIERYLTIRNTLQSALTAYIEGSDAEPIQLNALSQEPVILPSIAALEGQELTTNQSDDGAIAEAKTKHPVGKEAEASQSLPLSNESLKEPDGTQDKGEDTGEGTQKHRGRGRSAR